MKEHCWIAEEDAAKGDSRWKRSTCGVFLVVYGKLVLQFEDGNVTLGPGDFYVVPKGKLQNPVAEEECGLALIETVTTLHTGGVETPLTKSIAEQLAG